MGFECGIISRPRCVKPTIMVSELDRIRAGVTFTGFPVTETGTAGSKLLGLVTKRDTDYLVDREVTVGDAMTQLEDLTVYQNGAQRGVDLEEVNGLLRSSKRGLMPVVNGDWELIALVTRKDLKKNSDFPLATKNANKRLVVAASVCTHPVDAQRERVKALAEVDVDAIVVDSRQGDSIYQIDMIKWIKAEYPNIQVIGGNVVTKRQASNLIKAGVDGLRVGMGTGSVSTMQEVCACGRAQASAVYHVAKFARSKGIPVVADGGITSPGQIVKALSLGAGSVMCGSLLAGTEQSPGNYYYSGSQRLKVYQGVRSVSSMEKEANTGDTRDAAVRVARGVSGAVQDKGSVHAYIPYLVQSVKHGMQDIGYSSLEQLQHRLYSAELRFELRSVAAQQEGGVHDLHSYENKLYEKGK